MASTSHTFGGSGARRAAAKAEARRAETTERAGSVGLALLRLTVGALWLHEAAWKVPPDFGEATGTGLWRLAQNAVTYPVLPPFSWIVERIVLPNFAFFGWLVFLTEAAVGGFLLVGLATRLWAMLGALWSGAMILTLANTPGQWVFAFYLLFATHLALAAGGGGRVAGVDGVLRREWQRSDKLLARLLVRLS